MFLGTFALVKDLVNYQDHSSDINHVISISCACNVRNESAQIESGPTGPAANRFWDFCKAYFKRIRIPNLYRNPLKNT